MKKNKQKTVCLDVDGTLAEYDGDEKKPIGKFVESSIPYIHAMMKAGWRVVIFTSRPRREVEKWARKYSVPYDAYVKKPIMFQILIDDRAAQFNGDWSKMAGADFEPWWKGKQNG